MSGLVEGALLALFVGSSATDLSRGKIYNAYVFPFLAAGLVFHGYVGGMSGLGNGLFAVGLAFALFYPLWALGIVAAGDAKLLMAAAAWCGPAVSVKLAAASIVVGAIVGLPLAILRRAGRQDLERGTLPEGEPTRLRKGTRAPFAPACLVAFLVLRIAELHGWSL
jgi:prepilin peptidase CpaA